MCTGPHTKESGMSCGRKDSVKQMMSNLSAVAWIERNVRLELRSQMRGVHTVWDRGRGAADRTEGCGKEQGKGAGLEGMGTRQSREGQK